VTRRERSWRDQRSPCAFGGSEREEEGVDVDLEAFNRRRARSNRRLAESDGCSRTFGAFDDAAYEDTVRRRSHVSRLTGPTS
jgi:hypothetical protein